MTKIGLIRELRACEVQLHSAEQTSVMTAAEFGELVIRRGELRDALAERRYQA